MVSVRIQILEQGKNLTVDTGPEVVAEAVRVLQTVSELSPDFELKLESHQFGGCAIDSTGEPLPSSTLKACQEADAILMGTYHTRVCCRNSNINAFQVPSEAQSGA